MNLREALCGASRKPGALSPQRQRPCASTPLVRRASSRFAQHKMTAKILNMVFTLMHPGRYDRLHERIWDCAHRLSIGDAACRHKNVVVETTAALQPPTRAGVGIGQSLVRGREVGAHNFDEPFWIGRPLEG